MNTSLRDRYLDLLEQFELVTRELDIIIQLYNSVSYNQAQLDALEASAISRRSHRQALADELFTLKEIMEYERNLDENISSTLH